MNLNKVALAGRLGQEPDMRYLPNGDAVVNLRLATTEYWKDGQEKKEKTEWHRVVFYRKLAEIVAEKCCKGATIYIEGKLRTRSWEKEGVKQYVVEIEGDEFQLISRPHGQSKPASQGSSGDE